MFDVNFRKAFHKSLLSQENSFNDFTEIQNWLNQKNTSSSFLINEIPFQELKDWHFSEKDHNLVHHKNAFFSVKGVAVKTNFGDKKHWEQAIIHQPEIGILGILVKQIDGVLYFLMQAKFEPGNINHFQLAPTFQATKSNYTQAHEGRLPDYAEYFLGNQAKHKVIYDQLQSEQNARFYQKKNRNTIIEITEDIKLKENFKWMTLAQIKVFLEEDNVVNMDARSVLACIPHEEILDQESKVFGAFGKHLLNSLFQVENSIKSISELKNWLSEQKKKVQFEIRFKDLWQLDNWVKDDFSISDKEKQYFKVLALDIEIESREKMKWNQPIIQSFSEGLMVFILKKINGVFHFLVQAKFELGVLDKLELAPSIHCSKIQKNIPFVEVLLSKHIIVHHDSMQSEEGGRFYKEQNRNMILEVSEDFSNEIPENYCWMTFAQITQLMKNPTIFNMQARSLLSLLRFDK